MIILRAVTRIFCFKTNSDGLNLKKNMFEMLWKFISWWEYSDKFLHAFVFWCWIFFTG